MRATVRITVVLALASAGLGLGCGGDGGGGGDNQDTDTNDPDAGVECDGQPGSCLDVGEDAETQYVGCCLGDVVYWCDDGEFLSTDCSEDGSACEFNSQLEAMWCM